MANYIKVNRDGVEVLLIVSNIKFIKKLENGCEILIIDAEKSFSVDNTFDDLEAQLKS